MVAVEEVRSDEEEEDEEELTEYQKEAREEDKRQRDDDYMKWRRDFDGMKREHKADQENSDKIKQNGNNFFKLGLYMQASMQYSQALELQPDNAVLYCNRSMAYLKQDMATEALADAEKSLEIDSTVVNIKAYWRKAQALLELGRLEEAEATADAGIGMEGQGSNQHLNRVRRRSRELSTMKRLCGDPWSTKMANGVEQRYTFQADGSVELTVFGHSVPATYDLSVEGNPRSMVIKMKPDGIMGQGPPPPPRPYIFEFQDSDQELRLCTPIGSNELPTEFSGPGFNRFRRCAPEAPEPDDTDDAEALDLKCTRYIAEMNRAMPLLPPQLPESPSEQEIDKEVQVMEKISKLRRKYGSKVHERSVELAKCPQSAGSEKLVDLATELQKRFVVRLIMPPPPEPEAPTATVSQPTAVVSQPTAGTTKRPKPFLSCFAGICGGSS